MSLIIFFFSEMDIYKYNEIKPPPNQTKKPPSLKYYSSKEFKRMGLKFRSP